MTTVEPLCLDCKRLKSFGYDDSGKTIAFCEAYPNGIPEAVIYAGHIYPKPNDNGLQYVGQEGGRNVSERDEEKEYRELVEYYKEADMSDDEWIESKIQEGIPPEIAKTMLEFKVRRETW